MLLGVALLLAAVNVWLWRAYDRWQKEWLALSAIHARSLDREAYLREALRVLGVEFAPDGSIINGPYTHVQRVPAHEAPRLVPPRGTGRAGPGAARQPVPGVQAAGGLRSPGAAPRADVLLQQWFCRHGNAADPCPVCFPGAQVVGPAGRSLRAVFPPPQSVHLSHRPPPGARERWATRGGESAADPPEVQS